MSNILATLEENQVFSVVKVDSCFEFREECDSYYMVMLTQKEVVQLAHELLSLALQQTSENETPTNENQNKTKV